MEVPLEPWKDFLVKCEGTEEQGETSGLEESEWEWFEQLCEFADEECSSEVDIALQKVKLTVRLVFAVQVFILGVLFKW